jgi:hypothetical protein
MTADPLDAIRAQTDTLRPDDCAALRAIEDCHDGERLAVLIRTYYRDGDRADRTPRPFLYLHIGMLIGLFDRLRPDDES